MRLKVAFPLVAAVIGFGSIGGAARASYCGSGSYPDGSCSPEQCVPNVRYRVCYRTVTEDRSCTCYRPVYHTVMKECRTTVCRTVQEQHMRECRYTVCKPVYRGL